MRIACTHSKHHDNDVEQLKVTFRNGSWFVTYLNQSYIGKSLTIIFDVINKRNATKFFVNGGVRTLV